MFNVFEIMKEFETPEFKAAIETLPAIIAEMNTFPERLKAVETMLSENNDTLILILENLTKLEEKGNV